MDGIAQQHSYPNLIFASVTGVMTWQNALVADMKLKNQQRN
jgi:N-dimethylarginine dimethylaminohydrolase